MVDLAVLQEGPLRGGRMVIGERFDTKLMFALCRRSEVVLPTGLWRPGRTDQTFSNRFWCRHDWAMSTGQRCSPNLHDMGLLILNHGS